MKIFILIKTNMHGDCEILSIRGDIQNSLRDAEDEMLKIKRWQNSEEDSRYIAQWINHEHKLMLTIHCKEITDSGKNN